MKKAIEEKNGNSIIFTVFNRIPVDMRKVFGRLIKR